MSERKIRGIAICFGEHVDADGYHRCNKCDTKTILTTASGYWGVDEEPYRPGEESPADTPDEVFVGEVSGHWCPQCEMLVSFNYNFE